MIIKKFIPNKMNKIKNKLNIYQKFKNKNSISFNNKMTEISINKTQM